jgi:hypothetical protein
MIIEDIGYTPTTDAQGVIHFPLAWLSQPIVNSSHVVVVFMQYVDSQGVTRAMPRVQDNFNFMLGNKTLAIYYAKDQRVHA